MEQFWLGLLVGLILVLVAQKTLQSRKEVDGAFAHFGNHVKDVIYIFEVKPTFRFRYISPSLDLYLGEGVVAENYENPDDCFRRIHPDDYQLLMNKVSGKMSYDEAISQRWRTNDGRYLHFEEYTTPIYKNGEIVAVQGIIRNVEAAVMKREELEYVSRHDELTGVLNRRAFNETIDRLSFKKVGLIVIDLNDLKKINDHQGHSAGDQLLQKTGLLLQGLSENVYRIGGDEFVVLTDQLQQDELLDLTVSIRSMFESSYISAAVGAAWEEQLNDFKKLYDQADQNMYKQKNRSKTNRHVPC